MFKKKTSPWFLKAKNQPMMMQETGTSPRWRRGLGLSGLSSAHHACEHPKQPPGVCPKSGPVCWSDKWIQLLYRQVVFPFCVGMHTFRSLSTPFAVKMLLLGIKSFTSLKVCCSGLRFSTEAIIPERKSVEKTHQPSFYIILPSAQQV